MTHIPFSPDGMSTGTVALSLTPTGAAVPIPTIDVWWLLMNPLVWWAAWLLIGACVLAVLHLILPHEENDPRSLDGQRGSVKTNPQSQENA